MNQDMALMDADPLVSDSLSHRMVPILENQAIAFDTYRLRLGDTGLARTIRPGQFVMVRTAATGATDPLLGRPLALYDVVHDSDGTPIALDIVYLVVGRGTAALAQKRPGDSLWVWGPLGNGFGPPPAGPVLFVAGGIGQTPFLALGRWWLGRTAHPPAEPPRSTKAQHLRTGEGKPPMKGTRTDPRLLGASPPGLVPGPFASSITMLYGVRTAALLAGVDDFVHAGIPVEVATDDGTAGHHGYVTELLACRLERGERPAKVVGCGPPAMLATLARLVETYQVDCDVSLENHMACGFGACFSCVAPICQEDGSTDLRRVCLEGPVVPARRVDWSHLAH
jgi:dihydroorotate dehydrogenase electron transfer subunit